MAVDAQSGNPMDLHEALARTLHRRSIVQGSVTVPAVPALLEEYLAMCLGLFSAVGVTFDEPQTDRLREVLAEQLLAAFEASPRSTIVITYDSPVGSTVNYHVAARWSTIGQAYDSWVSTREPPLFGTEPDARVLSVAGSVTDPANCRVLDIGAGTGRNALALARRGHSVDALEVSGEFARLLEDAATRESLPITVIRRDVLGGSEGLRRDYDIVVVSEVVPDLRSVEELATLLGVAGDCLTPGGRLVLNAFLPIAGFELDDATRQLGQQTYTAVFTHKEILDAAHDHGLALLDDTSVLAYEERHARAGTWPPTPWYENWVSGRDLISLSGSDSPITMHWLVFRRNA